MKNMKKILVTVVAALLLMSLTVVGTLAYLTSTSKKVTNTFTIGKVTITLDETVTDAFGDATTPATRGQGNEYKAIPGETYTKDPIVHVQPGSEKCWLFVKVVNTLKENETTETGKTIAEQMGAKNWAKLNEWNPIVDGDKTIETTNIWYYNGKITENATTGIIPAIPEGDEVIDVSVFDTLTLSGNITDTSNIGTVVIRAYAVQADNLATALAAYTAAPCNWDAAE